MSPWAWLAMGCGCFVLVAVLAVGACGFGMVSMVRDLEGTMTDPVKRADATRNLMGYESLPDGYEPAFALEFPFIGDVAMLADVPFEEDATVDPTRLFVFFRPGLVSRQDDDIKAIIEGRSDPSRLLEAFDVKVRSRETIAEGDFELQDTTVRYVAQRGEARHQGGSSDGIYSLIFAECGGKPAMALWLEPEVSAGALAEGAAEAVAAEAAEAVGGAVAGEGASSAPGGSADGGKPDYRGTPADENAIRDFLAHFRLCGD
ncbi:hypothetical protein ABI59_20905 [Acidobacteria bacterium Mor1]|nr:hypothetical protein ABI59_20905 [Acidobacteria bacterium Mor1]